MTFEDLKTIFLTPALLPWEHDYYLASFTETKDKQQFLDYAYQTIKNLNGIWYEILGNTVYFVVKKGTEIPEDFAEYVEMITDVPEKPTDEGTV